MRAFYLRYLHQSKVALGATILLFLLPQIASARNLLQAWSGEYFTQKEGGLYLKAQLQDFKGVTQTISSIKVTIFNPISKSQAIISHHIQDVKSSPDEIWKLPAGKYQITSISLVDDEGQIRTWKPKQRRSVVVKRLSISNLGLWTIRPQKAGGLAVQFKMIANSYRESQPKSKSSFVSVIDGFSGLHQEMFAGKKLYAASEKDFSTRGEARIVITHTQQISMFFSLDLYKYNTEYGQNIMNVLQVKDPDFRRCYTDRLVTELTKTGTIKFRLLLSRQTGTIKTLKNNGGTLVDPQLIKCLYAELVSTQFPVQVNMIGEIVFTFGFQD